MYVFLLCCGLWATLIYVSGYYKSHWQARMRRSLLPIQCRLQGKMRELRTSVVQLQVLNGHIQTASAS